MLLGSNVRVRVRAVSLIVADSTTSMFWDSWTNLVRTDMISFCFSSCSHISDPAAVVGSRLVTKYDWSLPTAIIVDWYEGNQSGYLLLGHIVRVVADQMSFYDLNSGSWPITKYEWFLF